MRPRVDRLQDPRAPRFTQHIHHIIEAPVSCQPLQDQRTDRRLTRHSGHDSGRHRKHEQPVELRVPPTIRRHARGQVADKRRQLLRTVGEYDHEVRPRARADGTYRSGERRHDRVRPHLRDRQVIGPEIDLNLHVDLPEQPHFALPAEAQIVERAREHLR